MTDARPTRDIGRFGVAGQLRPLLAGTIGLGVPALSTALGEFVLGRTQRADIVMIYLLGVVLVALRFDRVASAVTAVASVVCFDFFFVPPYHTFAVYDPRHLVTFAVMFFVAVLVSSLTQRVRREVHASELREQRTASLYALSRELASVNTTSEVAHAAARHTTQTFNADAALWLADPQRLGLRDSFDVEGFSSDPQERAVAEWVWENLEPGGLGTGTGTGARALYLPLSAPRGKVGVLGVRPRDPARFLDPAQRQHLAAFASQIALAIERSSLAVEAQNAELQVKAEQLRNALLSSVSHDLRTPLGVITGAASSLLEGSLSAATRQELTETVLQEAQRLNTRVRNLLDMTRLEAEGVRPNKEWQPLEEVVGATLTRLEQGLRDRPISIQLALDLPLVPIDAGLIEQALINLLENAVRYTPEGSPIEIGAEFRNGNVEIIVHDHGPGITRGDEARIFDKFYRGQTSPGGVGLGLAICRAIAEAHGGRIWAESSAAGGAVFHLTLAVEGEPPTVNVGELSELN